MVTELQAITLFYTLPKEDIFEYVTNIDKLKKAFVKYNKTIDYILDYYYKYNDIPSLGTLYKDNEEVNGLLVPDNYNKDAVLFELRGLCLKNNLIPVLKECIVKASESPQDAIEGLIKRLMHIETYSQYSKDITKTIDERQQINELIKNNKDAFFLPSGFPTLDEILGGGYHRGEELVVFMARIGSGKSWTLLKTLTESYKQGKNVAILSPEMSSMAIGYRFDTLLNGFNNFKIRNGCDCEGYNYNYASKLKESKNKFLVVDKKDCGNSLTVRSLGAFCKKNEISILGIDGLKILQDYRRERNDNLATTLQRISEDLMDLSIELKIPIIVSHQANRLGIDGDNPPSMATARDSDGLAQNASVFISSVIKKIQDDLILTMSVEKNRYGHAGQRINYKVDLNNGIWEELML